MTSFELGAVTSFGLRFLGSKPDEPQRGDVYFDQATGQSWIWMSTWIRFTSTAQEYQGTYMIEEEP